MCLPLKHRVVHSTMVTYQPYSLESGRPEKYKDWEEESLRSAYEAVVNGMSVRQAAKEYNVPRSTLHDRVTGRVQFGSLSGPPRYLTDEEEDELATFLIGAARIGYGRSRKDVLAIVQGIVEAKGHHVHVSSGWWDGFRRRHKELTLRVGEKLSYARLVASNAEVIDHYYDVLEKTLMENHLFDKPGQIFNCDETGMPLDPNPPLIVAGKGQKHPQIRTSGDRAQITVLACCNAAGYVIPPYVVFDRKKLNPQYTIGEVPGTFYGLSDSGWMDRSLFRLWFEQHFLAYAPPYRPLLLLMDGHSSHYDPSFIRMAADERVILFCLPPHTTHLTQPLDKGCFGPLKSHWKESCHAYLCKNPGRVITRYQFSSLFREAWMRGMILKNVIAGFRTTGVFPFDRTASRRLKPPKPVKLCEKTGLSFIPLYSPLRPSRPQQRVPTSPSLEYSSSSPIEQSLLTQSLLVEGFPPFEQSLLSDSLDSPVEQSGAPHSHLKVSENDTLVKQLPHNSLMSKFLLDSQPVVKPQTSKTLGKAKVLTSSQCIAEMEEKERLKQEEIDRKKAAAQKRKDAAERKKMAKEAKMKKSTVKNPTFSVEQVALFERRLQEGYDLDIDENYNQWLQLYHPDCTLKSLSVIDHTPLHLSTPNRKTMKCPTQNLNEDIASESSCIEHDFNDPDVSVPCKTAVQKRTRSGTKSKAEPEQTRAQGSADQLVLIAKTAKPTGVRKLNTVGFSSQIAGSSDVSVPCKTIVQKSLRTRSGTRSKTEPDQTEKQGSADVSVPCKTTAQKRTRSGSSSKAQTGTQGSTGIDQVAKTAKPTGVRKLNTVTVSSQIAGKSGSSDVSVPCKTAVQKRTRSGTRSKAEPDQTEKQGSAGIDQVAKTAKPTGVRKLNTVGVSSQIAGENGYSDVSVPCKTAVQRRTRSGSRLKAQTQMQVSACIDQVAKTAKPTGVRKLNTVGVSSQIAGESGSSDMNVPRRTRSGSRSKAEPDQTGTQGSAGLKIEVKTSTLETIPFLSACTLMKCPNAHKRDWIQCENCSNWYHCCCANVTLEEAKEHSFHFFCFKCSLM